MIIYLVIIGLTVCISFLLNYFVAIPVCGYPYNFWQSCLYILISIVVVIVIDAILAFVIRRLPNKWFHFKKRLFKIRKWEKKFYEKLKIKKWKDLIPELGQFTNFSKSKVTDPTNNEYVERFLLEICYGEVIHYTSILFGFLIIFLFNLKWCWCIGIPIAIANGIINMLSLMILRYNRPKLMILHERNERTQKRKLEARNEENAEDVNDKN